MQEEWRDVKGYEGLYQVSNFGRVKSLNYNRKGIKKIMQAKSGSVYFTICLWSKGVRKVQTVHRLVAEAFIPNPNNLEQINHIDGNKKNNVVSNLEWVTRSENAVHSAYVLGKSPGNWSRKKVRCVETGEVFDSQILAAKAYHTSQGAVGNSARGNRPRAGGVHWEFVV